MASWANWVAAGVLSRSKLDGGAATAGSAINRITVACRARLDYARIAAERREWWRRERLGHTNRPERSHIAAGSSIVRVIHSLGP
jgi:hypothetical protein